MVSDVPAGRWEGAERNAADGEGAASTGLCATGVETAATGLTSCAPAVQLDFHVEHLSIDRHPEDTRLLHRRPTRAARLRIQQMTAGTLREPLKLPWIIGSSEAGSSPAATSTQSSFVLVGRHDTERTTAEEPQPITDDHEQHQDCKHDQHVHKGQPQARPNSIRHSVVSFSLVPCFRLGRIRFRSNPGQRPQQEIQKAPLHYITFWNKWHTGRRSRPGNSSIAEVPELPAPLRESPLSNPCARDRMSACTVRERANLTMTEPSRATGSHNTSAPPSGVDQTTAVLRSPLNRPI